MCFDDFTKLIRKKNVFMCSKILLIRFSNIKNGEIPISTRVFLTSFLIKNYSNELLGKEEDRHPADVDIYNWSVELIESLEKLRNYNKLYILLRNYGIVFEQWKTIDKNKSVERLITAYYYREKHIKKLKVEENIDDDIRKKSIDEIKNQQKNLLINLKIISPDFEIEYLKENYEKLFNSIQEGWKKTVTQLTNTMKLAYYNYLIENIEEENMEPVFKLIQEIRKKLLVITPSSIKSVVENTLSDNNIVSALTNSNQNWSTELKNIISLIVNTIIKLDAAINDEENKKWKLSVISKFTQERNKLLPRILIEMEEKIDNIFELIKKLADNK